MGKSIKQITDIIEKFCEERKWWNEDPNQLLTSTFIELGELAEHYQWKNKFEKWDEVKKREVGYEFVDVIFYLFRIARQSNIDIEKYFDEKLPKLEKKFLIGQSSKEHFQIKKDYRKTGKNKLYE